MKTHSRAQSTNSWRAGLALLLSSLAITPGVFAASGLPAALSGDARPVIDKFLREQVAGLPGKVGISIDTPRSGPLPACDAPEAFLPGRARLWGRVSVGIRCHASQPWTRYVPVYISIRSAYYVAARPISVGHTLTLADAEIREGDLASLPRSVLVDPAQFDGARALNPIASGAPLRQESLRLPAVVRQGQTVKISTQGAGFVVSTEGRAMSSAAAGALVQVKMHSGQLISATVNPDGTVERSY